MTSHHSGTQPIPTFLCSTGPLVSHIEAFAATMIAEGYAPYTLKTKYELVSDLSAWLARRSLPLAKLDEPRLRYFYSQRRGGRRRGDARTEQQLLAFLRKQGAIAPQPAKAQTALDRLMNNYEYFLRRERGLSDTTVARYLPIARRFLIVRFRHKAPRPADLHTKDLHRFILRSARLVGGRHTQMIITVLRSFMRFLRAHGAIKTDLSAAITAAPERHLAPLPRSLAPDQLRRVLAGCDLRTSSGRRDYAMLLLLSRLGLRGGEVRVMTLDDLDWQRGELIVRGKGTRHERLPLPQDVGAALVDYLRHGRPACSTRQVFVRTQAPWHGFSSSASICCLVARALKRAGLNPPRKGAHLFRHSLATNLLRRGASLREIGELLRHRQLKTTQIYAKVDIEALRTIALPWMGGGR